jgi:hypothetical protein
LPALLQAEIKITTEITTERKEVFVEAEERKGWTCARN